MGVLGDAVRSTPLVTEPVHLQGDDRRCAVFSFRPLQPGDGDARSLKPLKGEPFNFSCNAIEQRSRLRWKNERQNAHL